MEYNFKTPYCNGTMYFESNDNIVISGEVIGPIKATKIGYISAAPYDGISSFSGSGLPYPNKMVAFSNNPNKGMVNLNNNKFQFKILRPNSYYEDFNTLREPFVRLSIDKIEIELEIPNSKISYRTLQYPKSRKNPNFYTVKQPIRSQEQILLDSAYNVNREATNFWGLKPPT
jgi:hypothetical protein